MKKSGFLSAVACGVMLMLTGCGADAGDKISSLLETVPDDAVLVATVNGDALLNDLDAKKDGDTWTFCSEVEDLCSAVESAAGMKKDELLDLISADYGVDMAAFVLFATEFDDDTLYFTGYLTDAEKFKDAVKELDDDARFRKKNDLEVYENIAIKGNRFWFASVRLDNDTRKDDWVDDYMRDRSKDARKAINKLMELESEKSFMATEYGKEMSKVEKDVYAIMDIDGWLTAMSRHESEFADAKVMMSMVFDDARYFTLTGDLQEDRISFVADVLNKEYAPAKYLIPMEAIDANAMKAIGGDPTCVVAYGISEQIMSESMAILRRVDPSMFRDPEVAPILNLIGAIEGTMAAGADLSKLDGTPQTVSEISAVATVSFKDSQSALNAKNYAYTIPVSRWDSVPTSILEHVGITCTNSGKQLNFSYGKPMTGGTASLASELEGKLAGAVIDFTKLNKVLYTGFPAMKEIKKLEFFALDKEGGISYEINLYLGDAEKNAAKTIVEIMAKAIEFYEQMNRRSYNDFDYYDSYDYYEPAVEAEWAEEAAPAEEEWAVAAEEVTETEPYYGY